MIDWGFIASLEGKDILNGYVPNPESSRSGVTIATGIDLGHMTRVEFAKLPAALQEVLQPYLGLIGADAVQALKSKPLTITPSQALALNLGAVSATVGPLRVSYNGYAGIGKWEALPDRAQTVIASVAYQYGTNLAGRCPKFWAACVHEDWGAAVAEFEHFGDKYQPRHDKEAAYLKPLIPAQA